MISIPRLEGVIFDLDGTLLDTENLSTACIRHVVSRFGKEFTSETKRKICGMRKEDWSKIVVTELGLDGVLDPITLIHEWESGMLAGSSAVAYCKGALELTALIEVMHLPMAIATSSTVRSVQAKRTGHEEMFNRISTIITGDDHRITAGKPDPCIYLLAAAELGIDPTKCLAIEDSVTGALSASRAGMFVIAVPDVDLYGRDDGDGGLVVFRATSGANLIVSCLLDIIPLLSSCGGESHLAVSV